MRLAGQGVLGSTRVCEAGVNLTLPVSHAEGGLGAGLGGRAPHVGNDESRLPPRSGHRPGPAAQATMSGGTAWDGPGHRGMGPA